MRSSDVLVQVMKARNLDDQLVALNAAGTADVDAIKTFVPKVAPHTGPLKIGDAEILSWEDDRYLIAYGGGFRIVTQAELATFAAN